MQSEREITSNWTRTEHDLFSRASMPGDYKKDTPLLLTRFTLFEHVGFDAEISEWCHGMCAGTDGLRGKEE
jgi:hypothetical protein